MERDPELRPTLKALVESSTRGDPMSPLLWTSKSAETVARELTAGGHRVSSDTALRLLKAEGYTGL